MPRSQRITAAHQFGKQSQLILLSRMRIHYRFFSVDSGNGRPVGNFSCAVIPIDAPNAREARGAIHQFL
jgi:hypothetical protein